MADRLVDRVPRILEKLIVDPPVIERQRRDLDQIDELSRLDETFARRLRVECTILRVHCPDSDLTPNALPV